MKERPPVFSKLKEYYRYRRGWNKLTSDRSRLDGCKNLGDDLKFYSQFIRKGSVCFDVGANVGDKTELFLQLGATVVAVEPQQSCQRILRRRFGNNKNVYIEACALAEIKGKTTLFIDKSKTLASISQDWISTVKRSGRFSSHKWSDKLSVAAVSLDDLIEKYGKPGFCKIDVEGAELEVLRGLSSQIDVVSFEFVSERATRSLDCIDYLAELGKAEFNYCLGSSLHFALPDWSGPAEFKVILNKMSLHLENYGDIYVRFTRV